MIFDLFQYDFMRRRFIVGILLAVIIPCIGVIVVFKRLSLIGDALSHTSLAGVAIGLLLGINPVLGAIAACLLAAFGIEAIRKRIPRYSELSIAIVLSVGVGLAGVLSGFVKNTANFNSFLFGASSRSVILRRHLSSEYPSWYSSPFFSCTRSCFISLLTSRPRGSPAFPFVWSTRSSRSSPQSRYRSLPEPSAH
jgi:hypothetical protein